MSLLIFFLFRIIGNWLLACIVEHTGIEYPGGIDDRLGAREHLAEQTRHLDLVTAAVVAADGVVVRHGAAVAHDRGSGYEVEVPGLFRQMLAGAKAVVDPAGILNPGVLYDARTQPVANDSK